MSSSLCRILLCCLSYSFLMTFLVENISREWLVLIKWSQIIELRLWEGLVLISELAVIRVAIKGSGYHTIALSLSLSLAGRVPGHGDYRDYLQCRVSWLQSPNPPDHYRSIGLAYRCRLRSETRETETLHVMTHDPTFAAKSNAANDIIIHSLKQIVIELQITSIWYLILIKIWCGAACTCSFCKPCLDKAAKGERVIIWALLFTIPRYLFLKYAGRPSVDVR